MKFNIVTIKADMSSSSTSVVNITAAFAAVPCLELSKKKTIKKDY